jgi:UDP-glucose 4-epimerase
MNRKVLVTGGAGYIGSHTVRQLGEAGYEIVVYDNLSTGSAKAVMYGELVVGDLQDVSCLQQTFAQHQFEAVLHFAASISVPESIANPLQYYANNTQNTLNLLRCCQTFGVKQFVFSSTAAVYGEPQENPVRESSPTEPINPYGCSKLMSERIIRDYGCASDLRHVILRYFNVAGADPQGRMGQMGPKAEHLIKVACDTALGRRPAAKVFGTDFPTVDGTGVRDFIHVEDLAAAHIDALRYLEAGGESQILNCGYGQGYSVRQVLEQMKTVAGIDFPVMEVERRAGDPASVIACADRIRQLLGWQPKFNDLEVILSTALAWEKRLLASTLNEQFLQTSATSEKTPLSIP